MMEAARPQYSVHLRPALAIAVADACREDTT
jgi:hypothetical protein